MAVILGLGGGAARAVADDTAPPGKARLLIVVGIPGDPEHERHFASIAESWRSSLTRNLSVDPQDAHVLFGANGDAERGWPAANAELLAETVASLRERCRAEDSLWTLVLAHAHDDGRRGWLHLAGPDIHDGQWAALFADVPCRRQVFWMTHSCSGAFLQALSRPGRVVAVATAPASEGNETEMPQALATILQRPASELDRNGDGKVSLAEMFIHVHDEVASLYEADRRAPTEQALLDDNGDGRATSASDLIEFVLDRPAGAEAPERLPSGRRIDGAVSDAWIVHSQPERASELPHDATSTAAPTP